MMMPTTSANVCCFTQCCFRWRLGDSVWAPKSIDLNDNGAGRREALVVGMNLRERASGMTPVTYGCI